MAPSPTQRRRIVRLLRRGGVIAYPTEAVFGLGCDPLDDGAVLRILTMKQRPIDKGLILIAADFAQIEPYVLPVTAAQRATLNATWPGPVTWLLPARPEVPIWLRGEHASLAVRVTAHPLAAELCRLWGGALVSTSANISDRPPARTPLAVRKQLGRQVDYVVCAATGGAKRPSEIRDLLTDKVVRLG